MLDGEWTWHRTARVPFRSKLHIWLRLRLGPYRWDFACARRMISLRSPNLSRNSSQITGSMMILLVQAQTRQNPPRFSVVVMPRLFAFAEDSNVFRGEASRKSITRCSQPPFSVSYSIVVLSKNGCLANIYSSSLSCHFFS